MNILLRYLPYASVVGDEIVNTINDVKSTIKTIASAIFGLLALVVGIYFVFILIMELIDYHKTKEVDWKRLILIIIAIVVCGGGAALAFAIGGAA